MFATLSAALASFDRLCGHLAAALQQAEPHIYGVMLVAALVWVLLFPPRNDLDEV